MVQPREEFQDVGYCHVIVRDARAAAVGFPLLNMRAVSSPCGLSTRRPDGIHGPSREAVLD